MGRDITDRRRAEERLRSFLEFAPDAVVMIDSDGRIVLVNERSEEMFGYTRAELVGGSVEILLPERFRASHVAHRGRFLEDPRARPMGVGLELYGARKDGTEFPVDISVSPLGTGEGILLAAAIRDVTERKRLEAVRDQFIGNAAHELRTPMATLAMLGDTLAERLHEMSKQQIDEALGALRRQSERASVLVANLLDLSQLDGGRAKMHLERVPVAAVVEQVLETAPPPDGVMVETHVAEGTAVIADVVRMRQILTNLLSNAYRYGGHHVRIEAEAAPPGAFVTVSDDGAGVSDDLIPTVFEPFTRGKTAGAVGGSGIGLAVCRRLVEAFGGALWYENATPHGARFVMRFRSA